MACMLNMHEHRDTTFLSMEKQTAVHKPAFVADIAYLRWPHSRESAKTSNSPVELAKGVALL